MEFKQLRFKKRYLKALLSGQKTTTVRMSTDLKPGDLVELVAGGTNCGYARIEQITRKQIMALTDEDAVKDGFGSLEEFITTLKKYYKISDPETCAYIISFRKLDIPLSNRSGK